MPDTHCLKCHGAGYIATQLCAWCSGTGRHANPELLIEEIRGASGRIRGWRARVYRPGKGAVPSCKGLIFPESIMAGYDDLCDTSEPPTYVPVRLVSIEETPVPEPGTLAELHFENAVDLEQYGDINRRIDARNKRDWELVTCTPCGQSFLLFWERAKAQP